MIESTSSATAAMVADTGGVTPPSMRADGLGRDAFLQLLMTQLQHQDPTKPMDDAQFITQLAQFSSLDTLTRIDESLQELTAQVKLQTPSTATSVSTPQASGGL